MIVASPNLLSEDWMLIGRQEDTGFGGRIDLLSIAPDGSLVLIELKRDRTPREVVAQALDYASWLATLQSEEIAAIYGRFRPGGNLKEDFQNRFSQPLDEENLNASHQIVIVAAMLDDSTERIIRYLNERGISINILCFQVFRCDERQILSRSWLIDPVQTSANTGTPATGPKEPWNGEFYCSFGNDRERSWDDASDYGFMSAGGGAWFTRTLQLLKPGDRIWVLVPKAGYVGVGRVRGFAVPASRFSVYSAGGERNILDVANRANYFREAVDDLERCEHFVSVAWLQTVPLSQAFSEVGLFGNQNTVCKPTTPKWRHTVDRLKVKFSDFDRDMPR